MPGTDTSTGFRPREAEYYKGEAREALRHFTEEGGIVRTYRRELREMIDHFLACAETTHNHVDRFLASLPQEELLKKQPGDSQRIRSFHALLQLRDTYDELSELVEVRLGVEESIREHERRHGGGADLSAARDAPQPGIDDGKIRSSANEGQLLDGTYARIAQGNGASDREIARSAEDGDPHGRYRRLPPEGCFARAKQDLCKGIIVSCRERIEHCTGLFLDAKVMEQGEIDSLAEDIQNLISLIRYTEDLHGGGGDPFQRQR